MNMGIHMRCCLFHSMAINILVLIAVVVVFRGHAVAAAGAHDWRSLDCAAGEAEGEGAGLVAGCSAAAAAAAAAVWGRRRQARRDGWLKGSP